VIQKAFEAAPGSRTGVDHSALASSIREQLNLDYSSPLILVTNQPITPPPQWRYTIWQPVVGGVVLSTAALDPAYWEGPAARDASVNRLRVLKHRTRAANAGVLGSLIGFYRCDNPACFLFADIDSVTRLDDMLYFGAEHAVPDLTGRGFAADEDPYQPATITTKWNPGEHAKIQT
jgi:hypothetical protein